MLTPNSNRTTHLVPSIADRNERYRLCPLHPRHRVSPHFHYCMKRSDQAPIRHVHPAHGVAMPVSGRARPLAGHNQVAPLSDEGGHAIEIRPRHLPLGLEGLEVEVSRGGPVPQVVHRRPEHGPVAFVRDDRRPMSQRDGDAGDGDRPGGTVLKGATGIHYISSEIRKKSQWDGRPQKVRVRWARKRRKCRGGARTVSVGGSRSTQQGKPERMSTRATV